MKNLIKTTAFLIVFVACKKQTPNITTQQKSNFNFENDYAEFQTKMTELDTLKIWIDHSAYTLHGSEKLEITKKNGNIKIKAEYREETFAKKPKWNVVYEKIISEKDTIWNFGKFLKQNKERAKYVAIEERLNPETIGETLKSGSLKHWMLQIEHTGNRVYFYTESINDLKLFMAEYFETMIKIHPKNKEHIYGY